MKAEHRRKALKPTKAFPPKYAGNIETGKGNRGRDHRAGIQYPKGVHRFAKDKKARSMD